MSNRCVKVRTPGQADGLISGAASKAVGPPYGYLWQHVTVLRPASIRARVFICSCTRVLCMDLLRLKTDCRDGTATREAPERPPAPGRERSRGRLGGRHTASQYSPRADGMRHSGAPLCSASGLVSCYDAH